VLLLASSGALLGFRFLRRLRPRWSPGVLLVAAMGAIVLAIAALDPNFLAGTFRGFGMRAIFLSLLLIVIMIFRPEGMLGRAEFSWAVLLRERRTGPTDEERAQDAWLSNPALGGPDARDDDASDARSDGEGGR
jgi:branched-chain amino acid transport system permease protein